MKGHWRWRPRWYSMVTLVVAGFVLVALPLLIAVIGGSVYVDRLSRRSEQLVQASVVLAREGQALETQLLQLERNARQYRIVGRRELIDLYRQRQSRLYRTLDALNASSLAIGDDGARTSLRAVSTSVAGAVQEAGADAAALGVALERFERMHALAERIAQAADASVQERLQDLSARSARVRSALFWLTAALIPITLAFILG